jgi:alpha-D-xyloside xylohydrolase
MPMGPDVQWTGEDPQGAITLHIFAGADGVFTLYEDDGESMGYQRGEFAVVRFAWDDAKRLLTIGDRDGTFPGMAAERSILIVLHEGGNPAGPVFEQAAPLGVGYSGSKLEIAL